MSDFVRFGLVALVVFLTHFQNSITGFGSAALALPFMVVLIGLGISVPALLILGWLIAALIVAQSWRQIDWKEYAKIIVLGAIGMPIGAHAASHLPEQYLKGALAIFMVLVGIHGLAKQYAKSKASSGISGGRRMALSGFVPAGGIMQGAFGTGGPLIVVYATQALADKSRFRATLCLVWVTLNPIVLGMRWAAGNKVGMDVLQVVGICLIPMVLGLVLGNIAHHRVNEKTFRKVVYAVLILSGLILAKPMILSGLTFIKALLSK